MSDVQVDQATIGKRIRDARISAGFKTLVQFANRIRDAGCENPPSLAKLSRIETGEQPVAIDILPIVSELTSIPSAELRPDLAELMRAGGDQ